MLRLAAKEEVAQNILPFQLIVHIHAGKSMQMGKYPFKHIAFYMMFCRIHRQQVHLVARPVITLYHGVHGHITAILQRIRYAIGQYQYFALTHSNC